ncbi:hypothetical protein AVEN_218628-1 [Araneus ventricosus]|uniref:Uncharacterized protein n=1 Tax=Araneus ventricosus TaxID=182803 RepID=A0A4Y2JVC6_ARAVE|nr:hypothetical protein AVEN_218628-1 [Araneus ventricosus]
MPKESTPHKNEEVPFNPPKRREAEIFDAEGRKCERFLEGEVFPFCYLSKHSSSQKYINMQIPLPCVLCIAENLGSSISFDCRIIRMSLPQQSIEILLIPKPMRLEFIPC